jgi:hypothetical protein
LKLKLERRIVMKKLYVVLTLAATLMVATLMLDRTLKVAAAQSAQSTGASFLGSKSKEITFSRGRAGR